VFLYIRSIAKNEDIAEEITQETFVKALKSIDSFDGSKDIRAWLFTIAKNTYFTYCKRQQIYVDREIDDTIVSQNSSVEDSLINEENAFSIHCFLHSMNEPYKEVFTLRVFGELSYKKIGALFSKSSGWARITYYRAKKQILQYMEAAENEKK
jgi:RNA polymerase sigma-70 factor, ECF subfamily